MRRMTMEKRTRARQPTMWVPTTALPMAMSHPFDARLNQLLREHGFDDFAETQCAAFYADTMGSAQPVARHLLPAAPDWLLRGHRLGAWDRVARRRIARPARLS